MNKPRRLHAMFAFLTGTLLSACGPSPKAPPAPPAIQTWRLLQSPWAATWHPSGIPEEGRITVQNNTLSLPAGQPMTGATFPAWKAPEFPRTSYALTYEARRLEGLDFFGTVTFPVGDSSSASFVLGGWGGTVTGISSLDFSDANENTTRAERRFENGTWYRIKLEVRPEDLRVWIDDRIAVNVSIKGRQVSLRAGDIDHCLPFGFATYNTSAEIRNVILTRL